MSLCIIFAVKLGSYEPCSTSGTSVSQQNELPDETRIASNTSWLSGKSFETVPSYSFPSFHHRVVVEDGGDSERWLAVGLEESAPPASSHATLCHALSLELERYLISRLEGLPRPPSHLHVEARLLRHAQRLSVRRGSGGAV